VPIILDWVQPKRVVDVGCGDGTWLSVFREQGVIDVLGIDGDYVEPENLQIPVHQFMTWNLTQPVLLNQTFDLAVSLEVAEHLPEESAFGFVDTLVRLSDVVLFSAAIPHQGGTNHINEQWPDYWIALFEAQGYIAIDILRGRIWDNAEVQPWYAQNGVLCTTPQKGIVHFEMCESCCDFTRLIAVEMLNDRLLAIHCTPA